MRQGVFSYYNNVVEEGVQVRPLLECTVLIKAK